MDYDDFGNFIGQVSDDEDTEESKVQNGHIEHTQITEDNMTTDDIVSVEQTTYKSNTSEPTLASAIILHEDKNYYPSAMQVYGRDVETIVHDEDLQPLTVPIVAPFKEPKTLLKESILPDTTYDKQFLKDLMGFPDMMRNIAVVGHLGHGKTSVMDMLISKTHEPTKYHKKQARYTDVHELERERSCSIKSIPMTMVLNDLKGKSYLMNMMDTPGHVNFVDEVAAACRISDGALLVVDVVEGVMISTELSIKHLVNQKIPIVLCVNKIDRLILELKLPPTDAYFKIKFAIEEVNHVICKYDASMRVSPEHGNVFFASSLMKWSFSLKSFAMKYAVDFNKLVVDEFVDRLWGDIYYDQETRKFTDTQPKSATRTFVSFILEPLYKIFTQVVGEDPLSLKDTLGALTDLKKVDVSCDVVPLLEVVLKSFFQDDACIIDCLINSTPSPKDNAQKIVERTYTGSTDSQVYQNMIDCDAEGVLMVQIVKLYNAVTVEGFEAFGRVLSGTIKSGMELRVLGEGFTPDDDEDVVVKTVGGLSVYCARYQIDVKEVKAGNWVLIKGIDASIIKTATLTNLEEDEDSRTHIFKPLHHLTESVLKVAVEPVNPTELPKMLDGLRKVSKSYPLLLTKVEESGEHILLGTGELYLDCVLYDLRRLYSEIEIKVADPVVKFCETVIETSAIKCFAETPNKKNKITMIAESLDQKVATAIETRIISLDLPVKQVGEYFEQNHGWDVLTSRNIWAFGPEINGPNVLVNDCLTTDKKLLFSVKESMKQGFKWGTREGPLSDEPIRNVKFRILDAVISNEAIYRGGGQIIPTTRRVCYSSFLLAQPRLMEPVYYVEIQTPVDCIASIYDVLARRRGYVLQDVPKPGSPLYTVKSYLPVIDSCGFETDLRLHTQGQAFCQQVFDHWQVVPGDPLDKSIVLRPLEASTGQTLARDFMIKTRRRKGLSEDVSITKFFDDQMLLEVAKLDSNTFGF